MDSVQLWREIQALCYPHSARTVWRLITQLQRAADAGLPPKSQRSPYTRPEGPSARAVSFAIVCPAAKRSLEAQTYVDQLCQVDTGMARANVLIQAFLTMVRERRGATLEVWMAEATHSGIEALARFARGLQADLIAGKVEDLDGVFRFLREQPWADATRVIIGGASRRSILAAVYAGRRPEAVTGVVNLGGAGCGRAACPMPTAGCSATRRRLRQSHAVVVC